MQSKPKIDRSKGAQKQFWGALIGGVASLVGSRSTGNANLQSVRETNATNVQMVRETNEANRLEAERKRAWDVQQVNSARRWDYQQGRIAYERNRHGVLDARRWDAAQLDRARAYEEQQEARRFERDRAEALAAEERGREYARQDREEHRAYNDPSAVRARLEAAGMNPLSGADGSGDFVASSGSVMPTFAAAGTPQYARSAIAEAVAASSGIAQGAYAQYQAPQISPYLRPDPGQQILSGFQSVTDAIYAEKEYELRKTQLEMEQERLTDLLERTTMRPTVGGLYDGNSGYSRRTSYNQEQTAQAGNGTDEPQGPARAMGQIENDSMFIEGYELKANPATSDTEVSENRHGDTGSSAVGLAVLGSDIKYTFQDSRFGRDVSTFLDALLPSRMAIRTYQQYRPQKTRRPRARPKTRLLDDMMIAP